MDWSVVSAGVLPSSSFISISAVVAAVPFVSLSAMLVQCVEGGEMVDMYATLEEVLMSGRRVSCLGALRVSRANLISITNVPSMTSIRLVRRAFRIDIDKSI